MKVTRVQDPNDRSHFEPQLDNAWPDLDKLEWLSAGMMEDFGLPAQVNEYRPGEFTVTIQGARAGLGGMPFTQAWRTLYDLAHGYAAGVRAGRGEPEICPVCDGWYAGRHSHPDSREGRNGDELFGPNPCVSPRRVFHEPIPRMS